MSCQLFLKRSTSFVPKGCVTGCFKSYCIAWMLTSMTFHTTPRSDGWVAAKCWNECLNSRMQYRLYGKQRKWCWWIHERGMDRRFCISGGYNYTSERTKIVFTGLKQTLLHIGNKITSCNRFSSTSSQTFHHWKQDFSLVSYNYLLRGSWELFAPQTAFSTTVVMLLGVYCSALLLI